jgi:hypothetical protein
LLAALKHDGARLLEQLLNDPELPQPKPELEPGEEHAGYRNKAVLIILGWITLRRPYLYSRSIGQGRCPLDRLWGFVDSYSPEVLRLSCRAAASSGNPDRRQAVTTARGSGGAGDESLAASAGTRLAPGHLR